MTVLVFQHAQFEDLGSIGPWLARRGATIQRAHLYAGDPIPSLDDVDLLIAMGGPMSVNDEREFTWLAPEKQAVRDAVARQIPVLGVCLGSQLIANALGARVYPNRVKEIGWLPIHSVPGPSTAFRFPAESQVFHWHGETFDLPPGAVHLARSEGCTHQAFQVGDHVIGLQFHLEMTAEGMRGMVAHCRHELVAAQYVQTEAEILRTPASWYDEPNAVMNDVLTYLVDGR